MIAIGSDHGGFALKEEIKKHLDEKKIPYEDFGAYSTESVDYAPIAAKAARYVASGQADFGVLICSTGLAFLWPPTKSRAFGRPFARMNTALR